MTAQCPYCGTAAKPNSAYCLACGQLLAAPRATAPAAASPPAPAPPAAPRPAPAGPVARPSHVRFPDGTRVPLEGRLVLGRDPGALEGHTVLALEDPLKLLSRSHLAIDARGARVTATDLGSANGTTLERGGASTRLAARLPVILEPGDALVIGSLRLDVDEAPNPPHPGRG